ncbi:MAG: TRAP transporter small permease [Gammaproteobacteria bacterium]
MQEPHTKSGTAKKIIEFLDRVETTVTTLAFVVLVAAIFADVLAREFTGTGLHWARQVGVYANIIVVMLGIGVASARAGHLRPRFADSWLPARWEPLLETLKDLVMAGFCLVFAGLAAKVTLDALLLQERSVLIGILIWPILAVIPLAFILAAIRHLIYALTPGLRPADPLSRPIQE